MTKVIRRIKKNGETSQLDKKLKKQGLSTPKEGGFKKARPFSQSSKLQKNREEREKENKSN